MILREYKIEDWSQVKDAIEPFTAEYLGGKGISVTAIEDDKVMACGGVIYITDTEGSAWLKISKDCLTHPLKWARAIKQTFAMMIEASEGFNVTTYILVDFCKGEKLARLLGMKKTSITEEYNGNIYNKYAVDL